MADTALMDAAIDCFSEEYSEAREAQMIAEDMELTKSMEELTREVFE